MTSYFDFMDLELYEESVQPYEDPVQLFEEIEQLKLEAALAWQEHEQEQEWQAFLSTL